MKKSLPTWYLFTHAPCVHIQASFFGYNHGPVVSELDPSGPQQVGDISAWWIRSACASLPSCRGRRLVSPGDRPGALAPGGPQGADGGDDGCHAGTVWQLGLGQQLPAAVQRHGPSLETVQARGRRRGESPRLPDVWSASRQDRGYYSRLVFTYMWRSPVGKCMKGLQVGVWWHQLSLCPAHCKVWDGSGVCAVIRLCPLRGVTTCYISLNRNTRSKKIAICWHMSLILYCVCPSYVTGCSKMLNCFSGNVSAWQSN